MEYGFRERLTDLLYPRRCPLCHEVVMPKGEWICPACRGKFAYIREPVCRRCGKEILSPEGEYCFDCTQQEKAFDGAAALLHYNEIAKASIQRFKYGGSREYADFYIAELLRRHGDLVRSWRPQLVLPVPIHKSRLRTRGFNQAEDLAIRIAESLEVPIRSDILLRTRKTKDQKGLNARERRRNLEQALTVRVSLEGVHSVLLIDDVYTTGSTLQACARVLKLAGVRRVYGAVVCIGRDT